MKKVLAALLTIVMLLSLVACNNKSTETTEPAEPTKPAEPTDEQIIQNVINSIDTMYKTCTGNSNLNDIKSKIEEAEKAYSKLDDALKKDVSNSDKIETAWNLYLYKDCLRWCKDGAEETLRRILRDPSSLQINSYRITIYYGENLEKPLFATVYFDYSAKNGFGGMGRDDWYYFYHSFDINEYEICGATIPFYPNGSDYYAVREMVDMYSENKNVVAFSTYNQFLDALQSQE